MVQADPPVQKQGVITFTPEVIQEHMTAYDQGIREVSASLSGYTKNNTADDLYVGRNVKSKFELYNLNYPS